MSAHKILFIIGAVCFSIGAIAGVIHSPQYVNWLCAGAAFVTWSYVVQQ